MSSVESIDFTDEEWGNYQSIPEQGYSHRHWLDHRNRKVMARLLAEAWDQGAEAMAWNIDHATGPKDEATNPYRSEVGE